MESLGIEHIKVIVVVNLTLAAIFVVVAGWLLARKPFSSTEVPQGRQNLAEFVMEYFYDRATQNDRPDTTPAVAAFLATCFMLILIGNLAGIVPIPLLNYPPTAFFSITLGLALSAVIGSLAISGVFNGIKKTLKHLVWPNPLQIISEITDVLSLSLRLFGNIAGEYLTIVLVSSVVAVGIPLILHALGLIPTFVQALVFTLLTSSFIAGAIARHDHEEESATDSSEENSPTPLKPAETAN